MIPDRGPRKENCKRNLTEIFQAESWLKISPNWNFDFSSVEMFVKCLSLKNLENPYVIDVTEKQFSHFLTIFIKWI